MAFNTRSYGSAAAPPPTGYASYGGRGAYNADSLFSTGTRDWQNDDLEVETPLLSSH